MKAAYLLGTILTGALALGAGTASAGDSRVQFHVHLGVPVYQAPPVYLHPHVVYEPRVVYHPHPSYYSGHHYSGHAPHYKHWKHHDKHYRRHGSHYPVRDYPLHASGGYAGSVRGGYR